MTLTKDVISELIREKFNIPVRDAREILELLLEEVKLSLESGHEVKISNFGKWAVTAKKARIGRNPHTSEQLKITARKVVTFHPSDRLRNLVNEKT